MLAQCFAAECCIARQDANIAARIKPQNSRTRPDCGQPAKPRSSPVPTAVTTDTHIVQ